MKLIERRDAGTVTQTDGKKILGYAAVFGPLSEDLGGFREKIAPGAFDYSLSAKTDIRAFVDHDSSKILGRSSIGTLKLFTDEQGLQVEIDPPDTSYSRDLQTLLTRGDISQMSFGFLVRPGGETWEVIDGQRIRTLTDLDLIEVSVVTIPAYPDTSVALRSLNSIQDWESRKRKLWFLNNRYRVSKKLKSEK
jgi:uncharacterized protein